MKDRDLLAGFAKSVLVHRHAFVPSVARTIEIGRTAALPASFDEALAAPVGPAVRALWAAPGARVRGNPLEALVDRYAAPAGMRALARSGEPLWLALAQLRRVDLPGAWKTLDALCAARPDWAWPLIVRSELGRVDIVFDKALRDLESAERLEPDNAWIHAFRARVLFQSAPGPAALAAMDRAVDLAPEAGWVRAWRADSRRKLGDLAGAEADLDFALTKEPLYDRAWLWQGKVLRARGKAAEAEKVLTRGLAVCPHFEKAMAERARARLSLGKVDAALADLEAASALNHRHNSLWNWTAELEPLNAEKEATLAALLRHADASPRSARAWAWAGEALTQAGRLEEGLAALDRAAALDARRPRLATWRGEALLRLGRLDEAARQLDAAVRADPEDGRARAFRGRLSYLLGRPKAAVADLEKACSDSMVEYSWLYHWRALARAAAGDHAGASADADTAVALEPRKREFRSDPLDALFAEDSSSLAAALFRGYVSHSLLFYRQNNLKKFSELLADGRRLRVSEPARPLTLFQGGPGWKEAFAALWQDDEKAADRLLTAAIRRAPENPSFHVLRGFVRGERYWGSRRLSPASIADFERALALDPDNLWARMGLGMALEMRRRFTRARAQFEAASRLAPYWAWPHVFRGVCLWYQAEHGGSIAAFARAAELDPRSELPPLFSARAKADIRDRSLVKDLDKALRLAPDSGFALSWRGRAMYVLTRLPEALGDLRRACRLLPDYDRGPSWLGVSLLEKGRTRAAVPLLMKARTLNPYYPTTLYPLAGALLKLGRPAEAAKIMKEGAFIDRAGVWIEHRISMSHPNPAAKRSRADLDRLLERSPRAAWAWAWRGQTELLLQNYGNALRDLERAISLDPRDPWARVWRGETLRRLGEYGAAAADFDAALKLSPKLSWPLAAKGDCLLNLGRPAEALRLIEKSLALQDYCGPAHAFRGRALLAMGRRDDANRAFESALELHPQDVWIRKLMEPRPQGDPALSFETRRLEADARDMGLKDCAKALSRGDGTAALAACEGVARREARLYRLRGWLKLGAGDAAGAAEEASRALDATLDPTDAAALWLRQRARTALAGAGGS